MSMSLIQIVENDRRIVMDAALAVVKAAEELMKVSKGSKTQSLNTTRLELRLEEYQKAIAGREWVLQQ